MQHIVLLQTLAQSSAPAANPGGGSLLSMWPLFVVFIAMYFLMIAPQRKRQKQHQAMLAALKAGDEVITNGGIYGKIQQVHQDRFVIKVSDQTRIEVAKGFVQNKVEPAETKK